MRTQGKAQFDFELAQSQARRLTAIAEQIHRATRGIEDSMEDLSCAWKGKPASVYLQKEGCLKDAIQKSAVHVQELADQIRRAAQGIYEAEMQAVQIAQTH